MLRELRLGPVSRGQFQYDVAGDGSLVYMNVATGRWGGTLGWVGADGAMEEIVTIDDDLGPRHPRMSPDGRRVVLNKGPGQGLALYDLDRSSLAPLTAQDEGNYPSWSRDGQVVTFASDRSGTFALYQIAADGSGATSTVTQGERAAFSSDWAPDGSVLVFYDISISTGRDIRLWYPDGTTSTFLATEFGEWSPRVSPDGRWMAYISDRSGEDRVYLQPFPEGGPVVDVSTDYGHEAVWSPDGSQLFFRDATSMMFVDVTTDPDRPVGRPQVLFQDSYLRDPSMSGMQTTMWPQTGAS